MQKKKYFRKGIWKFLRWLEFLVTGSLQILRQLIFAFGSVQNGFPLPSVLSSTLAENVPKSIIWMIMHSLILGVLLNWRFLTLESLSHSEFRALIRWGEPSPPTQSWRCFCLVLQEVRPYLSTWPNHGTEWLFQKPHSQQVGDEAGTCRAGGGAWAQGWDAAGEVRRRASHPLWSLDTSVLWTLEMTTLGVASTAPLRSWVVVPDALGAGHWAVSPPREREGHPQGACDTKSKGWQGSWPRPLKQKETASLRGR